MKKLFKTIKLLWKEIKARLKAKSPFLFRVIQRISLLLTTLAGIPEVLKGAGVNLPEPFSTLASKTIAVSAVVAYLVAKLPVDTKEATQQALKDIDSKKPE